MNTKALPKSMGVMVLFTLIMGACAAPAPIAAPQVIKETVVVEKVVEKSVDVQVVVTATPEAFTNTINLPPRKDAAPAPADKQILRWDLPGDFQIDAITMGKWGDTQILTSAHLTAETLDGKLRPELAEKWEVSADNLTWTFHLNKDAKFSDGSPITADDVLFSLNALMDPKWPGSPALYRTPFRNIVGYKDMFDGTATTVSGIKEVDPSTVAITLLTPQDFFPKMLGFWAGGIVSKKNVMELGKEDWFKNPVTSGMYKVEKIETGDRTYVELVPNEYYVLGPKPKLQKLVIEKVTDPSARLTRYLNNEVDVLYYPEPADVAEALLGGGEMSDDLSGNLIPGLFFFYFRHDKPPFDDVKVRQAFIMAIDQDKLGRSVLGGTMFKLKSFLPKDVECYKAAVDVQLPFDPVQARQLLSESKYAGKMPLIRFFVSEVLGTPTIGRWTRTGSAMAAMWQENLGVNVQLQTKEFEFEDKKEGGAMIYRSSRSPLLLDPAAMSMDWGKGAATADMVKFVNPTIQDLLAQADVEKDPAKRCTMYNDADVALGKEGVIASGFSNANYNFSKPWVRGIRTQTRFQFYLSIPQTYIAVP